MITFAFKLQHFVPGDTTVGMRRFAAFLTYVRLALVPAKNRFKNINHGEHGENKKICFGFSPGSKCRRA
jgi:hypothetical protein